MKQFLPLAASLLTMAFATSCGKVSTLEFKPAPIVLTAEGPLFEGSNTAQGVLDGSELNAFLSKGGFSGSSIKSARLVSARIFTLNDTLTLDDISEITLQLAAPQADMQKVAVLNPVPAGQNSADLQVAAEQEQIATLIQQPVLTCVADLNLKKDLDANLEVKGELVFEIEVKQ